RTHCRRKWWWPGRNDPGAPFVARLRVSEHFVGLAIQKAQPHRAATDDAFEMADATAATVLLARIQRDHDVAAFPDAVGGGVAAVADAAAERPHPNQRAEMSVLGGDAGGDRVGVVSEVHSDGGG